MGLVHAEDGRPLPAPNPTTQPFFDAAGEGVLRLPRCPRDGFFFYPRSRCPVCWKDDWTWEQASGRGVVHSFTIDRMGHLPAFAPLAPYAVAIVELEEGPRMTSRLVDCDVETVRIGMPVVAAFEETEGITQVHFKPA